MKAAGVAALALVAACSAFGRGNADVSAPPPAGDDGGGEQEDAQVPSADGAIAEGQADAPPPGDGAVGNCDDFQRGQVALAGFWGGPSGTPPEIVPGIITFPAPASGESSLQTERRKRGNKIRVEATFEVRAPDPAWGNAGFDGTYRLFDADASLDVDQAEYGAFEIGFENWQSVFRTFDAEGKPTTGHNYTPHLSYDALHTIVYEQFFDAHGYVHVFFDGEKNDDLSQDDVITLRAPQPDWQLRIGAIHKGNATPAITVDFTHLCVDP